MKGLITDIQRFSLHDGPGIRTTVFLKGCNMACAWCHNPETIRTKPQLHFYENNCIHCLKCLEVCPTKAQKSSGKHHIFERDLCIECGACAKVCFPGAMVMSGMEMDVEDVLKEIIQDTAYYKNSGGGVTLSGGEVFMQPVFAYALLKRCKDSGISTAIETNLYASWDKIEKVLEVTDLVMADIKHMDNTSHEKWTNVGNQPVIEHIQKLSGTGIPMIIRTPVIPGVNDSASDIEKISRFLSTLPNLMYYELLNFNPLADDKYRSLAMENKFAGVKPLNTERLEELTEAAGKYNIKVRVG